MALVPSCPALFLSSLCTSVGFLFNFSSFLLLNFTYSLLFSTLLLKLSISLFFFKETATQPIGNFGSFLQCQLELGGLKTSTQEHPCPLDSSRKNKQAQYDQLTEKKV